MPSQTSVKHLTLIVGTRPNFMKMASIVDAIKRRPGSFETTLIHTGQHYDAKLSKVFFETLGLPEPDINFGVGSSSHHRQTAEILERFGDYLENRHTDCVVVVGDVNSTMACALAGVKAGISVAHVEAGLESKDRAMPEEINRLVTDAIVDYMFCTTEVAIENLRLRGRDPSKMFLVGNTMIDTLIKNLERTVPPESVPRELREAGKYAVCTLHRPGNVDQAGQLADILQTISEAAKVPVIFPVHPRTKGQLESLGLSFPGIQLLDPLNYLEFLHLQKHAKYVLTDSGGIQEETTYLGTPCLTLRENTERPETVTIGSNEIVGRDPAEIRNAISRVECGDWKTGACPPLWDGSAGVRIIEHLKNVLAD